MTVKSISWFLKGPEAMVRGFEWKMTVVGSGKPKCTIRLRHTSISNETRPLNTGYQLIFSHWHIPEVGYAF